ncbi:MAG: tRNA (guanosine(46)-N7)-methyltransferase TrmB [Spirochaetes bacterium]|nr:tRNA (guanosine(46)-N7)-methyltransferase TrmB [Spirochaetota bacterium]
MGHIKGYDYELLEEVLRVEDYSTYVKWQDIFKNENKLIVEVGCGNGHFLNSSASEDKTSNFIGIDIKYKRLVRCREKQVKQNNKNVIWVWGEAFITLNNLFKDSSVYMIFMPFPDPWPKRRHHKHRLFKKEFIDLFYKKLVNSGFFIFITDFYDYYEESFSLIKSDKRFELITPDEFQQYDITASYFGEKWRNDNRTFYSFFIRKK